MIEKLICHIGLRHSAAQCLRSVHNEHVPAKKKPFLIVYTRQLGPLMTSKTASFGQDKN